MTDAREQTALDHVPPLTPEQRAKVRAFFEANPDGGYKPALHAAGIHATKAAAKACIAADDELDDLNLRCLGVERQSLLKQLGDIANSPEHKDRLRAITYALAALHGVREKSEVAITGAEGGPVEVVAHERRLTLADVLALRESLAHDGPGAGAHDELPAAGPLLPEPGDG